MQRVRDDDVNVIDAMAGKHVYHDLEHRLADVRGRHRRERQADVVHGDSDAHAWLELSEQGIATVRMI